MAIRHGLRLWSWLVALAILAFRPLLAHAQVSPAGRWVTLTSTHFRVHFRPGDEAVARHSLREGERAYRLLASELVPPRQSIDLVLSDAADFANGSAVVFPTSRIVLLLTPGVSDPDLQNFDDWIRVVLTHELTHIFHLDRVKGPWRLLQSVLGRAPGSFPNLYQPSWVTEGLAVYYESHFSEVGRLRGSFHTQLLLGAAEDDRWLGPNQATFISERWPDGTAPYAFGSRFFQSAVAAGGDSIIPHFLEKTSGQWIPFRTGRPLRLASGLRRDSLWNGLHRHYLQLAEARPPTGAQTVARGLRSQPALAISADGSLAWFSSRPDEAPSIILRHPDGHEDQYRSTAAVDLTWAADTLFAAWLDLTDPMTYRSDLHRMIKGHWKQITHGQRVVDIAAGPSGIVATQIGGDGNRLVTISGDSVIPVVAEQPGTTWASPAVRRQGGILAVQHDTSGYRLVLIEPGAGGDSTMISARGSAVLADPQWNRDGSGFFYVSDASGLPQIYYSDLNAGWKQLTDEPTGATQPVMSPDGWLYFATLESDGYALKRRRLPGNGDEAPPVTGIGAQAGATHGTGPIAPDSGLLSGYRPWPALRPHYFIPYAVDKGSAGFFLGAFTSGSDPVGRVAYSLSLAAGLDGGRMDGSMSLIYRRWNRHTIDLYLSQDQGDAGRVTAPISAIVRSRERDASLGLSTAWRRWYRAMILRVAADYEQDSFFSSPALSFINPEFVGASAGLSMSRVLRPPLSISDEDGASLSVRYRRRWRMDQDGWSDEWRGRLAGYLAIKGLGGFAHPVLGGRLAAATSGGPDRETFGIGGASGVTYQPLPGIVAGSRRQFPVRGFEAGEIRGGTAAVGTLELRVPVALVAAPLGGLPYGLDRVSLRFFYDYGRAWEPPMRGLPNHLSSAGVEVTWDLVVLYDVPLRLRTGLAVPLTDGSITRQGDVRWGLGFGSEF